MPRIDLTDDIVRHHIGVQRLASGAVQNTDVIFRELNEHLSLIMAINRAVITAPSKSRLKTLLADARNAIHIAYQKLEKTVLDELVAFTRYDVDFYRRLLSRRTGIDFQAPSETRIKSIAIRNRIGARSATTRLDAFEGSTVRSTLRDQEARCYRIVKRRIMLAINERRP